MTSSPPTPGPMQAAQRLMRPELPRRFYAQAALEPRQGGYAILLDGRPLRTPAKAELIVSSAALAEAIAAEWRAQVERIDPETMPLTRLANSALDGVAGREAAVAGDIARYGESDLLCYRTGFPVELAERQAVHWDPVLAWAERELSARFVLAEGVVHVAQPPETLVRIRDALEGLGACRLAAMHSLTTLTGSVLLALAHARGFLSREAAWKAAHVDEDWQITRWGEDEEAMARRARREAEFTAASRLLELCPAQTTA